MPTNTKTNKEKAAIKRRQRARKKAGRDSAVAEQRRSDLLQGMIDMDGQDPKVKAIALRAKRQMGAPTKLRPALASRIVKYMMEGNYLSTACRACGVSPGTFTKWMKQAEEALTIAEAAFDTEAVKATEAVMECELVLRQEMAKGDDADEVVLETKNAELKALKQASDELVMFDFVPEERLIHVHLHTAVQMAEGEAERGLLKKAVKGERGWQGAMAVMERRFRAGWGRTSTVDHTIKGDEENPVVFTIEAPNERALRVAKILDDARAIPSGEELEQQVLQPGEGMKIPEGEKV